MTHVLVCGGAGYIDAHMAKALALAGCKVTVFDNLPTGHRAAVQWGELVGRAKSRASRFHSRWHHAGRAIRRCWWPTASVPLMYSAGVRPSTPCPPSSKLRGAGTRGRVFEVVASRVPLGEGRSRSNCA